MFQSEDHRFMAQALVLARMGRYSTPPNPSVGCVIVKDGLVVGEGYHVATGGPHAEAAALKVAGDAARGATAYVTLEPCAHHGRTPPCAEALRMAGIARVVVAVRDPNPDVAGGGIEVLEKAGIRTEVGLLQRDAEDLNRGFFSRMRHGRPWATLKIGASLDGRSALANGRSQWITGDAARRDVQRLRARASAILTGVGTALADDPRLTVRDDTLQTRGRQPLRVVLDSSLRLSAQSRLASAEAPTLVFTARESIIRATALLARGVAVESVDRTAAGLDLGRCMRRLAELGCNEVLIEAGPRLAGAMLSEGRVDEVVLYVAPLMLGDDAQPMLRLPLIDDMNQRREFELLDSRHVGRDLRLSLRPQ
jgi:diaminohydroxyphosphoribosylaminopyrimidine deaminase/5-amino-6-(5-phosphoribosylamino)uracil reductase